MHSSSGFARFLHALRSFPQLASMLGRLAAHKRELMYGRQMPSAHGFAESGALVDTDSASAAVNDSSELHRAVQLASLFLPGVDIQVPRPAQRGWVLDSCFDVAAATVDMLDSWTLVQCLGLSR